VSAGLTGKGKDFLNVRDQALDIAWPENMSTVDRLDRNRHGCHDDPMKLPSLNVLGQDLQPCSTDPVTGFYRDGCCNTGPMDRGLHTVCAQMTAEFLALSKYLGNDLSTPRPEYGFKGLKPGDQWCLCASRFLQAHDEGAAPKVRLAATHQATLAVVPLSVLQANATDAD
jgi:uncharacterized protein (DUF2237 family)